ncbi:cation:proton antiporter [Marinobacter sp.]|uniref:cation:proton antiporter n=1 Tax=Marinobacter sp. TaxID=50741 RepID=UPI00384BAE5B
MTETLVFLFQTLLLVLGCLFFAVGTLGLFRFPDTLCRIHALTKVDNLGLGFIALGLLPMVPSPATGLKIVLIWLVVMAASATSAHLVARAVQLREGAEPGGEVTDD